MFSLPGRGFHQRVTLISSVPMTLDDVIVYVRQFIIALVSVDGCCTFSDPGGFFDVPSSSVKINTGVLKGDHLASYLFIIFLDYILRIASED